MTRAYDRAVNDTLRNPPGYVLGDTARARLVEMAHFRAAVDSAYAAGVAAGRAQAAADIRAHSAKYAPTNGNWAQRRLRMHLGIAERVAAGPLTAEEVAQALNEFFAARIAEGGEPR